MGRYFCLALCLLLLPVAGCGSDDGGYESRDSDASRDARDAERAPKDDPDDIAGSIANAFGEAFGGEGRAAESVDFRTLRDLLPEELEDFERTDASGEKTGVAGFSFSQAEGEYRSDDGERRLSLQIVDAGGVGQMAMLGASWLQMDVDRENSDGYERTTEFEGYPAFEKLRGGDRPRAELQFVVADRFFVSANGQNVEMDELKEALEEIDFDELEDLRDVGVEK
jgi:hypothetical protein